MISVDVLPQERSALFERSVLSLRRSLSLGVFCTVFVASILLTATLRAQEVAENPNEGTIQGTVRSEDGAPVPSARVEYYSAATDTRGVTRTADDGTFASEQIAPGTYLVRVDGRDLLHADTNVVVTAGAAATVNFKLYWINPGPARLESSYPGDAADQLPINGRNVLGPAEIYPAAQVVDGAIYDPGKSGFQSLSIDSYSGRTTHVDIDEIEVMDETKGGATTALPADAVSEVVVSRVTPEVFQSLNATGSVRIDTRSGGENWHGDLFGNLRNQSLGLAGFPSGNSDYSREQYGFGAGGAILKGKGYLFFAGERTNQDGSLPINTQDVILPTQQGSTNFSSVGLQRADFRQNLLTARLDYKFNEDKRIFVRLGYDDANLVGPRNSESMWRNDAHVPSATFGLDWNRGRYFHSARFGFQKLVNSVNPDLADSTLLTSAPFNLPPLHLQLGSISLGSSTAGPRQTIQRDLFARWDSVTMRGVNHTFRFGGAFHQISQGDYYAPGPFGPSVTSSNGLATIAAINGNPSLSPLYPGDPRGPADNPLNYPVGTITIYNGLGNFSEHSAFNRPTGGHSDYRFEGYVGDTVNVKPNVNVTVGVNYAFDTARTDSDLPNILALAAFSAIPPTGAYVPYNVTGSIARPLKNFAPQLGVAWDPGHSGRTVVRAGGGMFYDNFLLQNTYQDRINRLANGQYNRSLTLCPTGSVLFPDGSLVKSVNGVDIASGICGQPIGNVAGLIQQLQSDFQTTQSTIAANAPNVYSLQNNQANFGGLLAPGFKTPRIVHMNLGIERQMGERSMFSLDYVREIGTQFPLGIDTNHVGDASLLTDGDDVVVTNRNYASELAAISATVTPVGCAAPMFAGQGLGSSQAAVDCFISSNNSQGHSIVDFARNGLDSSNSFCGPFPCSVLGKSQASFGGANPAVGSNIMYFPAGRSRYQAIHFLYHTSSGANPFHHVQKIDVTFSYTLSRYLTNIAEPNGSGGDYSTLNVAEDYLRPHLTHFGPSGLDRRHQFVITPSVEMPHGPHFSLVALIGSPLPLSLYIPQMNGGGVPGEIFRSDISGDGTVGDLLTGTLIGNTGKYTSTKVANAISFYNRNVAGNPTPAGLALAGLNANGTSNGGAPAILSLAQLHTLGAYAPTISSCNPSPTACGPPGHFATATWLKTMDLQVGWPFALGERARIEPSVSVFNIFNLANFGGPGAQLNGVLDGSPGSSLNNSTTAGNCGTNPAYCTTRLDRVLPGSGNYSNGAPRQLQFGVRLTF